MRRGIQRRMLRETASAAPSGPSKTVTSLSSSSGDRWSGAKTVDVLGTAFVSGDQVQVDGANVTTTFIDATTLRANLPNTALWELGNRVFTVVGASGSANYAVAYGATALCDLDPSLGVTLGTGALVAGLADQVGGNAAKNTTQITSAKQFTLVSSDPNANNQPGLLNDGARSLRSSSWTRPATFMRFIVARPTSATRVLCSGTTNTTNAYDYLNSATGHQITGGTLLSATTSSINATHVYCERFDGVTSAIYIDSRTAAITGNAGSGVGDGLVIGSFWNDSLNTIGSFYRVIEVSGTDATTRNEVLLYLGSKYGKTIAP